MNRNMLLGNVPKSKELVTRDRKMAKKVLRKRNFCAGKHEYTHVAIQLAKMRAVFDLLRTADSKK